MRRPKDGGQDPVAAVPRVARRIVENVVVVVVYWGLSHLDWMVFNRLSILPMPLWPAAGLALMAAVMRGWSVAPGIALGAVLANRLSLSAPLAYACCIGVTNTLGPLAAAAIIRKRVGEKPWLLWRHSDYTAVFLAGVVLAPIITAAGGIGAKWLLGLIPFASVPRDFVRWWLGHAMGTALFAPLVLFFLDQRRTASPGDQGEMARYAQRATLLLGAFLWLVVSIFDHFYFRTGNQSFWSTLLALGQHRALVHRLFFVAVIAVAGFSLSRLLSQLAASLRREQGIAADLRATLDSIADAVIATDTRGVVTSVNPVAAQLTGWASGEAIGHPLPEVVRLMNAATRSACEEMLTRVIRTGQSEEGPDHCVMLDRNGGERIIAATAAPMHDRPGHCTGMVLVFRDITQRRLAELALRESQRFLADLVENSGALVFVKDRDGHYQLINRAWESVTGLRRDQVLGKTDEMLFPAADAELFRHNDLEVMTSGATLEREETLQSPEGPRHFISIKFPLRAGDGQVTGVCGMTTEISERKRAEAEREKLQAQLTHAQKMESVGRLAGGVAHDFNNMLQAILGNAELAAADLPPGSPVRESIDEIRESAQRSIQLTRQLLAFARRQTIAPKVLDLNATVSSMWRMLQRLIGEDIDLRWAPGADAGTVRMDPSQLDQILANLCVNARDAIVGTGRVSIATAHVVLGGGSLAGQPDVVPGDYVMLSVSDDGRGMDAETRGHLFEPFFTTKEVGKGTGLGLATVFGIVKQNGGYIDVDSQPGLGTTFKLYLPRASAELPREPVAPPAVVLSGAETILLVEDEAQILDLARRILTQSGYTVLAALSPDEALALAEQHRGDIQLLVTDVVMPGMNGKALRDELKRRRPDLRCLFMSGYAADVLAPHGVLEEGVSFLHKPFTPHALKQKVREVLVHS
jgi:PAS domain S-box-containing protein